MNETPAPLGWCNRISAGLYAIKFPGKGSAIVTFGPSRPVASWMASNASSRRS